MAGRSSAQIELAGIVRIDGDTALPRDLSRITRAEAYDDYDGVFLDESVEGGSAVVTGLDHGWLCYRNVKLPASASVLELRAASPLVGGSIELRCDHPGGELLGRCTVEATGGGQIWKTFAVPLTPAGGVRDLFLVLNGDLRLAWLKICGRGEHAGDAAS